MSSGVKGLPCDAACEGAGAGFDARRAVTRSAKLSKSYEFPFLLPPSGRVAASLVTADCLAICRWNTGEMGRGGGVSESDEELELSIGLRGLAGFRMGDRGRDEDTEIGCLAGDGGRRGGSNCDCLSAAAKGGILAAVALSITLDVVTGIVLLMAATGATLEVTGMGSSIIELLFTGITGLGGEMGRE